MSRPNKQVDPRDAYLKAHSKRVWATLSPAALADLKHFAKRAKEGREIGWYGMRDYFVEHHGLDIGRRRMQTIAREHGITPWWSL